MHGRQVITILASHRKSLHDITLKDVMFHHVPPPAVCGTFFSVYLMYCFFAGGSHPNEGEIQPKNKLLALLQEYEE